MQIIITAGNHDSSSKLEINRNLWKYAGVTVVGSIRRDEAGQVDLERHIVEVKNGCGELKGYVIALPHVYPQTFRRSMKKSHVKSGNIILSKLY